MAQEDSKNTKKRKKPQVESDVPEPKIQKASLFDLFKTFLRENIAIISFLQLVFAVIALFVVPNITVIEPKISEEEKQDLESEIVKLQHEIYEDVDQINKDFQNIDDTKVTNNNKFIKQFKDVTLKLVKYHGVHDKSRFYGRSIYESAHYASFNVSERQIYDKYIRLTINEINNILSMQILKDDGDYGILCIVNEDINNEAREWLYKDSLRICSVQKQLDIARIHNDSTALNNAIEQLNEYKADLTNYHFQMVFYNHILSINRKIRLKF